METTDLPELYFRSLYKEYHAHHKELLHTVQVTLRSGLPLVIPAGYITDGATVPRVLWGLIPPHGRHDLATLVHDFLLTDTDYGRRQADREMLFWLERSGVSWPKRQLMYWTTRLYTHIFIR